MREYTLKLVAKYRAMDDADARRIAMALVSELPVGREAGALPVPVACRLVAAGDRGARNVLDGVIVGESAPAG